MVTQEEDCQVILNVLLVGGGGDGDIFEGHAGGSGFVDFKQVSYCIVDYPLFIAVMLITAVEARKGNIFPVMSFVVKLGSKA